MTITAEDMERMLQAQGVEGELPEFDMSQTHLAGFQAAPEAPDPGAPEYVTDPVTGERIQKQYYDEYVAERYLQEEDVGPVTAAGMNLAGILDAGKQNIRRFFADVPWRDKEEAEQIVKDAERELRRIEGMQEAIGTRHPLTGSWVREGTKMGLELGAGGVVGRTVGGAFGMGRGAITKPLSMTREAIRGYQGLDKLPKQFGGYIGTTTQRAEQLMNRLKEPGTSGLLMQKLRQFASPNNLTLTQNLGAAAGLSALTARSEESQYGQATLGIMATLAMDGLLRGAGGLFNKITGRPAPSNLLDADLNPTPEFQKALDDAGMSWEDASDILMQDIKNMGPVMADDAANMARYQAEGQDPMQYMIEKEGSARDLTAGLLGTPGQTQKDIQEQIAQVVAQAKTQLQNLSHRQGVSHQGGVKLSAEEQAEAIENKLRGHYVTMKDEAHQQASNKYTALSNFMNISKDELGDMPDAYKYFKEMENTMVDERPLYRYFENRKDWDQVLDVFNEYGLFPNRKLVNKAMQQYNPQINTLVKNWIAEGPEALSKRPAGISPELFESIKKILPEGVAGHRQVIDDMMASGDNVYGKAQIFVDNLSKRLTDEFGVFALPEADIRKYKIGEKIKKRFEVSDYPGLRKRLNKLARGTTDRERQNTIYKAIHELDSKMNTYLNDAAEKVPGNAAGETVRTMMQDANNTWKAYLGEWQDKDIIQNLSSKKTGSQNEYRTVLGQYYDKLMKPNVPLGNFNKQMSMLEQDPELMRDIQSKFLLDMGDQLFKKEQLVNGNLYPTVSGDQFKAYLDKFKDGKLERLFKSNPKALRSLKRLQRNIKMAEIKGDGTMSKQLEDNLTKFFDLQLKTSPYIGKFKVRAKRLMLSVGKALSKQKAAKTAADKMKVAMPRPDPELVEQMRYLSTNHAWLLRLMGIEADTILELYTPLDDTIKSIEEGAEKAKEFIY